MDSLQIICAWCSAEIRPGVQPASHGLCAACRAQFEPPRTAKDRRADRARARRRSRLGSGVARPVVEVTIEPADPNDRGAVVDVQLEPTSGGDQ